MDNNISSQQTVVDNKTLSWPLKLLFFLGGQIASFFCLGPFFLIFQNNYPFYGFLAIMFWGASVFLTLNKTDDRWLMAVALPCLLNGYNLMSVCLLNCVSGNEVAVTLTVHLLMSVVGIALLRYSFFRKLLLLAVVALIPSVFVAFCMDQYRGILIIFQLLYMAGIVACVLSENTIRKVSAGVASYLPACIFSFSVVTLVMTLILTFARPCEPYAVAIIFAIGSLALACTLINKFVEKDKAFMAYAIAFLGCAASAITPSVALAVLGLLACTMVLHYVGIVMFGVFLVWSISFFYYDMQMTLAFKSYLLLGSGSVFLLLFFFLKRLSK